MKSCDCITKVNEALKTSTGDDKARLNIALSFDGSAHKPYMEYSYRIKKKDGTFNEHKKTGTMIPTYCPFCGKKYEEK